MGIETAVLVAAGIAATAEVGKAVSQSNAASARKDALDMQLKQSRIEHQQKTIANYDQIQKIVEAQEAVASVSGFAFSSPSFNAIQRGEVELGSKRQKNIDIESSLVESNIAAEKRNVQNTLFAQLFGDTAELASIGAGVYGKMPKST